MTLQIGHNLRYAHSSKAGITYADETGMMGYTDELDNGPAMCFNAAKSWQTGWYNTKRAVVKPSSATNDDRCFEGQLYGIADFDRPEAENVLVKVDTPNNDNYYVSFNRKAGVNSGTKTAANKVTVTRSTFEDGYQSGRSTSNLVAQLGSGDQYFATIGGKKVVVAVDRIDASSARVIISENGLGCFSPSTPLPTTASLPTPAPFSTPPSLPTSASKRDCSCSSKSAKTLVSRVLYEVCLFSYKE